MKELPRRRGWRKAPHPSKVSATQSRQIISKKLTKETKRNVTEESDRLSPLSKRQGLHSEHRGYRGRGARNGNAACYHRPWPYRWSRAARTTASPDERRGRDLGGAKRLSNDQ